jgi:hypothetical protein
MMDAVPEYFKPALLAIWNCRTRILYLKAKP